MLGQLKKIFCRWAWNNNQKEEVTEGMSLRRENKFGFYKKCISVDYKKAKVLNAKN